MSSLSLAELKWANEKRGMVDLLPPELQSSPEERIITREISKAYPALDISLLRNVNLDARTERIKATIRNLKNDNSRLTWQRVGGNSRSTFEKCGEWYTGAEKQIIICMDHPKTMRKKNVFNCKKRECPTCSPGWAATEGEKIAERLAAGVNLYAAEGVKFYPIKHHILSPPQEEAMILMETERGWKELKADAIEEAARLGIEGGVLIFHPDRCNNPKDKKSYRDDLPPHTWYVSPHFHILGVHRRLMKSNKFHEVNGWVHKNLGTRRTLSGTASYELKHAGIGYRAMPGHKCFISPRNFKTYEIPVWFGCMSKQFIGKKGQPTKVTRQMLCPKCSAPMGVYKAELNKDGSINLDGCKHISTAMEDVWVQEYYLKVNPYAVGILGDPPPFDETLHVPEEIKCDI